VATTLSTPRKSIPAFGFEEGFEEEQYADCVDEPMLSPSSKISIKSPKGKHIVTVKTTQQRSHKNILQRRMKIMTSDHLIFPKI
jgi:hypothetical protein